MRRTKREIIAAEASGDEDMLTAKSILLRRQREEYAKFSKEAGLLTQNERTQVYGFGKSAAQKARWKADKAIKMASPSLNDWSKTVPQTHSKDELDEITAYAKERGIKIFQPQKFDGNMDMLRKEIDTIYSIKEEYNIREKVTIEFASMHDDVYAETVNNTIRFNKKSLRNADITNKTLNADNQLAATDFTGIAVHEMGHIISHKYGEKGLDIVRKAYYNIFKENITSDDMLKYLSINVSVYSTNMSLMSKKTKYKEIIPEILSKSKSTSSSDFADEFTRLMKEACL